MQSGYVEEKKKKKTIKMHMKEIRKTINMHRSVLEDETKFGTAKNMMKMMQRRDDMNLSETSEDERCKNKFRTSLS